MTANNTNATPEFRQFYVVNGDEDCNRAMTVYRTMEANDFKPLHLVMDVETGTRYVTSNQLGHNEVIIHNLTLQEQVTEYFTSAIFTISNEADDRASLQLTGCDSFNDTTIVMCEVEWGLNEYGFKWYAVADSEQARDMMDMHGAMVIEVTENGCSVFRG